MPRRVGSSNNDILFVGMNEANRHEADALRKRGNKVTYIGDSFEDGKIRVRDANGRQQTYDLTTDEGIDRFAYSLGLSPEATAKIVEGLKMLEVDGRDEYAMLAREFAKAENGGPMPSRLVLSGHHTGSGVYGDNNGKLKWEAMEKLVEATPNAARRVEDLHLAACWSGGEDLVDRYRAMFPNLKTIFAYAYTDRVRGDYASGSAPGTWTGAIQHQAAWDRATRGGATNLNRNIVDRYRKGENAAVWSIDGGYQSGTQRAPLDSLRQRLASLEASYPDYFSGRERIQSSQTGPVRDYYNALQRMLQHPDLPAAERGALEAKRDQAIRLIYFSSTVAPRFQQHHRQAIDAGFRALGLTPPDFSRLSRAEALQKIDEFERAYRASANPPEAARQLLPLLTEGLRDLSPSRIPDAWV